MVVSLDKIGNMDEEQAYKGEVIAVFGIYWM